MGMLLLNNLHWLWLSVMIICLVVEALTFTLTTIWFALGAFIMIFLSQLPIAFKWQLLIFVAISLTLLIFTRPLVSKRLSKKSAFNMDALLGKKALVTSPISEFEKGEVRVNGVLWAAKSEGDIKIEKNSECIITEIEGNTLVVKSVH